MDKLTAIIVTLIGIILVLPLIGVTQLVGDLQQWLIALGVLVIGIDLLMKVFKK